MNMEKTVFQSSILSPIYKYLFTTAFSLLSVFLLYRSIRIPSESDLDSVLLYTYAIVWSLPLMFRLKNVIVTGDSIVIKNSKMNSFIKYDDIIWVYEIAFFNPTFISLKYLNNREKRTYKKILIMASGSWRKMPLHNDGEMVSYIRERIMAKNPQYSQNDEPSHWIPFIILLVTSIPIGLLSKLF